MKKSRVSSSEANKKIKTYFNRISSPRRTFSALNLMVFATFFAGLREPQSPKKSRVSSSEANNKIKFNFNRIVVYSKNNP